MQDYDREVHYYIQHKRFAEALEVLRKQVSSDSMFNGFQIALNGSIGLKAVPDMFYRFSPILMQEMPSQLISVLIQWAPQLDSTRLIPTLVQQHIQKDTDWHHKQVRLSDVCHSEQRLDLSNSNCFKLCPVFGNYSIPGVLCV